MRVLHTEQPETSSNLVFYKTWHILGPFQIGTREATWGVDPLEQYGGFSDLKPDDEKYPSSLGTNGEVSWSTAEIDVPRSELLHEKYAIVPGQCTAVSLSVAFPEIHWPISQAVYGWSALQWQAWARGTFIVHGSSAQTIKLSLPGILEFEIDGQRHFGGDYFSFNKATLIQLLEPGVHTLNIRVVRDVRVMGAIGDPVFNIEILAEKVESELLVLPEDALFPDFVVGHGYAGRVCSIPVQNAGQDWVEVVSIIAESNSNESDNSLLLDQESVPVAPGQIRTIAVRLNSKGLAGRYRIGFHLNYRKRNCTKLLSTNRHALHGKLRKIKEPQRMIFQLPNGNVSYALIQPPPFGRDQSKAIVEDVPVLIVLHGAGVEVESLQTREMLDSMGEIKAWVVVPTGGSQWSADDWHTWGLLDVQAAVKSIPDHVENISWKGPGVDLQSLYVVGHSNGGQGTWHILTHMPDKIRAAAPVSGYSSIQKYVPYEFEREVDPRLASIIQASLTSYRHELLVSNAKGIYIQQQHGSADDNVPVFHSRRMYQLLMEAGSHPRYNEIPNKNHWYSGIMATPQLQGFYNRIACRDKDSADLPLKFSLMVPSTGEVIGSRGGIVVEQLQFLGQFGRIDVERVSEAIWTIKTSNVRRLRFGDLDYRGPYPRSIKIDGEIVNMEHVTSDMPLRLHLDPESHWKVADNSFIYSLAERSGTQFGTLNAILRTKSELQIRYDSDLTYRIALQISRNLFQYYSASSTLVHDSEKDLANGGVISIKAGVPEASATNSWIVVNAVNRPINICRQGVKIHHPSGIESTFPHCAGLGAIYLTPRANEELQLVIWGYDKKGLQHAARLAPGLTGVGQPDFIIFGPESGWKGAGNALAMGFFDHDWSISASSYIS